MLVVVLLLLLLEGGKGGIMHEKHEEGVGYNRSLEEQGMELEGSLERVWMDEWARPFGSY